MTTVLYYAMQIGLDWTDTNGR